jgi:tmRNA-binding protein
MGQRTKNTENIIAVNKKATHDYFILRKNGSWYGA